MYMYICAKKNRFQTCFFVLQSPSQVPLLQEILKNRVQFQLCLILRAAAAACFRIAQRAPRYWRSLIKKFVVRMPGPNASTYNLRILNIKDLTLRVLKKLATRS